MASRDFPFSPLEADCSFTSSCDYDPVISSHPPPSSPSPASSASAEFIHSFPSSIVDIQDFFSPYLSYLYLTLFVASLVSFFLWPHKSKQTRQLEAKERKRKQVLNQVSPYLMTSSNFSATSIPDHIISSLSKAEVEAAVRIIRDALTEDIGGGDVSTLSTVSASSQSTATFLAKDTGIISGIHIAELVFYMVDPNLRVQWDIKEGNPVTKGNKFGTVTGSTRSLLTSERIALNFIQRMSGIATATRSMVETIKSTGSTSRLLDTRKTVPGLRLLDKLSVRHGGGVNHRIGLYDMIMIKDNHIKAAGSITQALNKVRKYLTENKLDIPIEVEVRTEEELIELLAVGYADISHPVLRIMLDNTVEVTTTYSGRIVVNTNKLSEWLNLIKNDMNGSKYETEASGNVTVETVGEIAKTNVTFISTGAITHSVKTLDISLKIN